jgi:hypothetical protein
LQFGRQNELTEHRADYVVASHRTTTKATIATLEREVKFENRGRQSEGTKIVQVVLPGSKVKEQR